MNKATAFLILVITLISCREKIKNNTNENIMASEFISRVHTSELETDHYKLLGTTSLQKHIVDFHKINWKENYWNEFNSGSFNMTNLEVLNNSNTKYLTITTAPNSVDTFQFIIGLGTHKVTKSPNLLERIVKLYMTETENSEDPEMFIELFFKRNYDKIQLELDKLTFMDEIEDLYININN